MTENQLAAAYKTVQENEVVARRNCDLARLRLLQQAQERLYEEDLRLAREARNRAGRVLFI